MLQKIQKLHKTFMSDEKRVRNSSKAVEDSMDTRWETKRKLSMWSSREDLATLEKKVKELNMRQLNQKVRNIQQRDGWDFSDIKVQSAELPLLDGVSKSNRVNTSNTNTPIALYLHHRQMLAIG